MDPGVGFIDVDGFLSRTFLEVVFFCLDFANEMANIV
jgi:hypothetical protein